MTTRVAATGYEIPIAFIIFNRPEVTARTFGVIARIKPRQLFVISDGARPNRPGEAELVARTRKILDRITWPCEIRTNFSEINLGCKRRVSSGISWVFDHVDKAVILEDDCFPSSTFFRYCEAMLERYKEDKRVFSISGSNFDGVAGESGHYFSRYALMWGWATWRDRWQHYVLNPTDYNWVVFRTWWSRPVALLYWLLLFRELAAGRIDTWDYQWILTVWRHRALSCRPSKNLVANIGFGQQATHTTNASSPLARLKAHHVPGGCATPLTGLFPDQSVEDADERAWAYINVRSVLLMAFPSAGRLRSKLTGR